MLVLDWQGSSQYWLDSTLGQEPNLKQVVCLPLVFKRCVGTLVVDFEQQASECMLNRYSMSDVVCVYMHPNIYQKGTLCRPNLNGVLKQLAKKTL